MVIRLPDDFYRALTQSRKAVNRGDLPAAMEWTSLVERHLRIAERHEALLQSRDKAPRATAKPKDPREQPGYRNPLVWPKSWTPEQIAAAEREMAEEAQKKKVAAQAGAPPPAGAGQQAQASKIVPQQNPANVGSSRGENNPEGETP